MIKEKYPEETAPVMREKESAPAAATIAREIERKPDAATIAEEKDSKPIAVPEKRFVFTKPMQWASAIAASVLVLTVGIIIAVNLLGGEPTTRYIDISALTIQKINTEQELQQKVAAENATAITLSIDGYTFNSCDGFYDELKLVAYRVQFKNSYDLIEMTIIFKDGYTSDVNEREFTANTEQDIINEISIIKRHYEQDGGKTFIKFKFSNSQFYLLVQPDNGEFSLSVVDAIGAP
jgi:hypothetical protein